MDVFRMPKIILKERLYSKRKKGRPRKRWIDDVIKDLATMGVRGWSQQVDERGAWRRIVEEAKAHQGL